MKKVLSFFGGDSQVGTTMVAQSVAEYLAGCHKQVLYIKGSGKSGEEFMNVDGKNSIDDLKAGIISGKVAYEDLCQVMSTYKGISVIPSVRNPFASKYFPENTYEVILSTLEDRFDYVVIDGGDNANLGLTISALSVADHRFFVTTQQSKSVHRLVLMQKNILEPLNLSYELIINKYQRDPALLLKKDVLLLCEAREALLVPYLEYGWQMEMEGRSLMHFRKFEKAIETICGQFEKIEKEERPWKKNFVWKNI